jgi:fructose-bisphosphate aldolase class I
MNTGSLKQTASQMVAAGKGIIAADESSGTCQKRFDSVGVECTEENRRQYRQLIITAPDLEKYVSGIILFDETIKQKDDAGKPFAEILAEKGVLPGIKVDGGTADMEGSPEEKVTKGLDGLPGRLQEYAAMGAKFAKWRAVITIGANTPTDGNIRQNARDLAAYAKACQEASIVPMVEPEVLIDGDHTIERCYEASVAILKALFEECAALGVAPEGMILKASMVIAGKQAAQQSTPQEVAEHTVRALTETVPENLAGVVFLSGGQADEQATANLDAMNKIGGTPWPLTFSYSRAIQNPVLKIWGADTAGNIAKAQAALIFRSRMNSLASVGQYDPSMETERPY